MTRVQDIAPPFVATERQNELAKAYRHRKTRVVLASGAIRSGKSQGAARLLVETALQHPSTYAVARLTYRELEDSTKRLFLAGDGQLPPLLPAETVKQWRASDNMVELRNGSRIIFRSLDDSAKWLNLTLGGLLIDQVEELYPGLEGEDLFNLLLGRLSDSGGPRKTILIANPGSTVSWQFRRLVAEKTRDKGVSVVHFTLGDNAANLPAEYVAELEATKETRPHWYRSFVLGRWGEFAGRAYPEFDADVHVVEPFELPESWERFESMDFGAANPTCWLAWTVDYDGNLVVFDEYYEAGKLISQHAPEVVRRRKSWHPEGRPRCYADPSIWSHHGHSDRWGAPASIATEFAELGVSMTPANNDRAAGFVRMSELLHVQPGRIRPPWAGTQTANGAPRLYVFRSCENVIGQLQNAPLETEKLDAGKAVEGKWESAHGHAHAAARYGAMSRPSPSVAPPDPPSEDPRVEAAYLRSKRVTDYITRREDPRRVIPHEWV